MNNLYSVENCIKTWHNACGSCSYEEKMAHNSSFVKYWDYLAKKESQWNYENIFAEQIVNVLISEGLLKKDSTVLDIGSGGGAYSLALARKCASVTALDMSGGMLKLLSARRKITGLNNINIVQAMWENFVWDHTCDLVFSSMCPAICDFGSLLKMEHVSHGSCALLTIGKGSFSKMRSELRNLLTDKPLFSMSPDVIYPFNVLYAQGKKPLLRFFPHVSYPTMSVPEALEAYSVYFGVFGIKGKSAVQTISDYLNAHAENGVCTDEVHINLALLGWRKKEICF